MSPSTAAARRTLNGRHIGALTVAAASVWVLASASSNEKKRKEQLQGTVTEPTSASHQQQQSQPQQLFSHLRALPQSIMLPWNDSTTTAAEAIHQKTHNNGLQDNSQILAPSVLMDASSMSNETASPSSSSPRLTAVRRRDTLRRLDQTSTKASLESKYDVKPEPIGEGSFGKVYVAQDRHTGEWVAIKKIWKQFSNNKDFLREMNTLLQIRAHGGHPHICSLRENFNEPDDFALVLDLIKGGEMFDYLVDNGAYSELDASRLIREAASALAFLHGIGLVHFDLKPENLMLSSKNNSSTVKLVDFGCSETLPGFDQLLSIPQSDNARKSRGTVAYSPPESFKSSEENSPVNTAHDMWSLGIILHVMLTGVHPFDPYADASDADLAERIRTATSMSLEAKGDTAHLSESAIDLLSKLLEPDPSKRLKASEMFQHSWVRGETARSDIMEDSDNRLSRLSQFKSMIERNAFQELMSISSGKKQKDSSQEGDSLALKAYKSLEEKGLLAMDDVETDDGGTLNSQEEEEVTLSAFEELLGDNLKNMYFPSGQTIFNEGDIGEHMYFLNSGTCAVSTSGGFKATLNHGDTFGEGGLLNENRKRSATISTVTPVHAIQIDRDCFTKYLLDSDSTVALQIKERINQRKFGRAEFIIGNQKSLVKKRIQKGDVLFAEGDLADSVYFLEAGSIDVNNQGHTVYHVDSGELLGVQSFYLHRPRKSSAVCTSNECILKMMSGEAFGTLNKQFPELKEALKEKALRREFRLAVVRKSKKGFHKMDLREVFDDIDQDKSGQLSRSEVRDLLTHLDVEMSEAVIQQLLDTLDLDNTGFVNFEEFKSVFQVE